jgi:hypothetical protein
MELVAIIIESGHWDVKFQCRSSMSAATVSKDLLDDEVLLVVLSNSQRIGADRIVDEKGEGCGYV